MPPPPRADPFTRPPQPGAAFPPAYSTGASPFGTLWTRLGSLELGIAAGAAALAFIFAMVGLILPMASDADSESHYRGEVWEQAAIALAIGAAGWAVVARARLGREPVVSAEIDRYVLWGLAGGAVLFAVVSFALAAGFDAAEEPSALNEIAWRGFAFTWALLTLTWAAYTRQLEREFARKLAFGFSGAAIFFLLGGLVIGNTGSGVEVFSKTVQAGAWWGLALVLLTLSTAALLGRRDEAQGRL